MCEFWSVSCVSFFIPVPRSKAKFAYHECAARVLTKSHQEGIDLSGGNFEYWRQIGCVWQFVSNGRKTGGGDTPYQPCLVTSSIFHEQVHAYSSTPKLGDVLSQRCNLDIILWQPDMRTLKERLITPHDIIYKSLCRLRYARGSPLLYHGAFLTTISSI